MIFVETWHATSLLHFHITPDGESPNETSDILSAPLSGNTITCGEIAPLSRICNSARNTGQFVIALRDRERTVGRITNPAVFRAAIQLPLNG
ncbi:MAG: hypothetical protein LBL04_07050 [Bacteroidales bacterium]|nr:hypothetical protein [Bacteroidales bacterium]